MRYSLCCICIFLVSCIFSTNGMDMGRIENYNLHSLPMMNSPEDNITTQKYFISDKLAKKLKPVLKEWLEYYNAEIRSFYKTEEGEDNLICPLFYEPFDEEEKKSIYYREFEKEDDIYDPLLLEYSPNKKYYLNVRATSGVYKDEDNKYYYFGGDDCQEIYLTNREAKRTGLILWLGASTFAETSFWLDNKTYIVVGRDRSFDSPRLFIKAGTYFYFFDIDEFPEVTYFDNLIKRHGIITERD